MENPDPWISDIGPEEHDYSSLNTGYEFNDFNFSIDPDGRIDLEDTGRDEEVEIPLIDEGKFILPPTTHIPGHLGCPIIRDEAAMVAKSPSHLFTCPRHRAIKKTLGKFKKTEMLDEVTSDCYLYISEWVDKNIIIAPDSLEYLLKVTRNWSLQHLHSMIPAIKGKIITAHEVNMYSAKILRRLNKYSHLILDEYLMMKKVELLKDKYLCFNSIPRGTFRKAFNLRAERDLSYFIDNDSALLLPTTLLLGALDKCQSMFGLKLYWLLVDCFRQYPGYSIFNQGSTLINHLTFLRKTTGQDFFSIAQALESLITGWTIRLDGDAEFDLLFTSTAKDIQDILDKHKVEFDVKLLLPQSTDDISVSMWLELIGVQKTLGYPTLLGHRTLDQERANCMHDRNKVDFSIIDKLEGLVKRDLSKNYFAKHGKYPNMSFCPPELIKYIQKSIEVPSSLNKQYHIWKKIKFTKTLKYDFTPDQTELLKDSATCLNLSAWPANYDRCAFKILYGKDPPKYAAATTECRTIGAFLNATADEVRKVINKRENYEFDEENKICMQCMKELELKINGGREFTKQTAEQRLAQTSMEYNVANSIFPYVPEQSMTDGEILAMRRSLDQVDRLNKNSEFIALDIQKWCFSFRHSTTRWLGEIYDDLFGLNKLYENSHMFFINCSIFSSYRMNPPDYDHYGNPVEGDYFLKRARGGKEGLRQKPWTHVTVSCFKLAIEMSSVLKANIIVQGDNQAAAIDYPRGTPEEINAYRANLLDNLHKVFNAANLELKKNETWYSKHLHEYGRVRVYKGNYVKQGTKKSTRLIPDINDGLFSINSSISALNTMTEGIAKGDRTPHIGFLMNQILVANYILRKNLTSDQKINGPKKLRQVMVLLNTPADFGGLPLTTLMSHSVRGQDDKVILWIGIAKAMREYFPSLFNDVMQFWITAPHRTASTPKERKRWYEDIFCLNIKPLPTADNIIKRWSLSYLKSPNVTNPVIKQLYQGEHIMGEDELFQNIDTMEPMFLPLAHNLVQYSNYGLLLRMQHRLTSTKTLERVTQYAKGISLLDLIVKKNTELTMVVRNRLNNPRYCAGKDDLVNEECPSVIAKKWRLLSWGKQYLDVTSLYHHQVIIKSTDDASEEELRRSIVIDVSADMTRSVLNCHSRLGPFKPYIGSETAVKITRSNLDVSEKTSFTKAILHLLTDRSWAHHTQSYNIIKFIDLLILEKISVVDIPNEIKDIVCLGAQVIGGNPLHRYECESSSMAALINFLPTITTHYNQSSNNISQKYAAGDDISLFYQLTFIMNMVTLSNVGLITHKLAPQYVAILSCEDCCRRIDNVKLDIAPPTYTGSNINVFTPVSKVTVSEAENQIPWIEAYSISRQLSVNIDKNYAKFHNNSHTVEKLENMIKTKISLNDLRKMNLRFLLINMIANSNHCKQIIGSQDSLSISSSHDRSFGHVAELMINSGRLKEFIYILGHEITEHTMATHASKLSHHIARSIKFFFNSVSRAELDFLRFVMIQDLEDSRFKNLILFANKLRYINKVQSYTAFVANCTKIVETNSLKTLMNLVDAPKPYIIRTPAEQIQTLWRSSSQTPITDNVIFPNVFSSPKEGSFPDIAILGYHHFRATDSENYLRIDEISHLSRKLGNISSAATKYLEIIHWFGLQDKRSISKNILCMAEGSGSVVSTLGILYPNATLSYNTWRSSDIDSRDDSTSNLPPAILNSLIPIDRFVNQHRMCAGETNILTSKFREKLEDHLQRYNTQIVTMDAESTLYSTNIDFAKTLLPTILKHSPEFVIFKMFILEDFRDIIDNVVSDQYRWVIVKPISSNPHGFEVFLVILNVDLIFSTMRVGIQYDKLKSVEDSVIQTTMNRKNWFGSKTFRQYLYASKMLTSYWDEVHDDKTPLIKSRYDEHLQLHKCCGLICTKNLSLMYEQLDKIHTNQDNPEIFTLIRKHGINETIRYKILDIIFVSFFLAITYRRNSLKSIEHVFRSLCHLSVETQISEYRAKLPEKLEFMERDTQSVVSPDILYILKFNLNGGDFFDDWYDKKWFFRAIFDSKCLHKMPERGWTKIRRNGSLSHFVSHDIELLLSTVPEFLRFYNTRYIISEAKWKVLPEYAKGEFYSIPEKYYFRLKPNKKEKSHSYRRSNNRSSKYQKGDHYNTELDPRYESKLPEENYSDLEDEYLDDELY